MNNADLITYTATGDVDVLALVRAQAAAKATRTVEVPAQRDNRARYTQPAGSAHRIGDTWDRVSSSTGARSTATFLGMDGDLAVFDGIDL